MGLFGDVTHTIKHTESLYRTKCPSHNQWISRRVSRLTPIVSPSRSAVYLGLHAFQLNLDETIINHPPLTNAIRPIYIQSTSNAPFRRLTRSDGRSSASRTRYKVSRVPLPSTRGRMELTRNNFTAHPPATSPQHPQHAPRKPPSSLNPCKTSDGPATPARPYVQTSTGPPPHPNLSTQELHRPDSTAKIPIRKTSADVPALPKLLSARPLPDPQYLPKPSKLRQPRHTRHSCHLVPKYRPGSIIPFLPRCTHSRPN